MKPILPKRHRGKRITWIGLHALWLIVLTIAMQYLPFTRPDEKDFLKWAAIWRHNMFHQDQKGLDSVVFIDTSPDIALIPDNTLKIDTFPPIHPPVRAITDRVKLAYFFNMLSHHVKDYRYIVLDIFLHIPSTQDRTLDSVIRKTPKLIISAYFDEEKKKIAPPVFPVPYAPVVYIAQGGSSFYKMPVYGENGMKSLPVVLYEKLSSNRFTRKAGMVWLNNNLSFNYILPEFYYRQATLVRTASTMRRSVNTYYLDQLINAGDDAMPLLKDKYIVVGNFTDDQHDTYIGKIPGPVLMWDVFLSLKVSPLQVTFTWLLFLFVVFLLISAYQLLRIDRHLRQIEKNLTPIPWLKDIIAKYVSWLGVVILINLISTLLFNVAISTFYLATYLTGFALVVEKFYHWLNSFKKLWKKYTA